MQFTIRFVPFTVLAMLLAFIGHAQASLDIQTWKTSTGTKVLFVESAELPMLDVEMTFDAGSSRDGNAFGLASFTSAMLGMETKNKNEEQMSELFSRLGAQLSTDVGRDQASIRLRTLTRESLMTPAINGFQEVLAQPKFSQEIFERERKRLLTALQQKAVKPQEISSDLLWATLYEGHPYAHPVTGTSESVNELSVKQLTAFYKNYYNANNAVIAMVGAIDKAKAKVIAEQLSKALPKGKVPAAISQPKPLTAGKEIVKEFDSSQTYFTLTQLGVERGNKDYVPLFVGNHLLGGSGFGSLLMEEVREKRGLVYSVYSYMAPMMQQGPLVIGLSTKNASAREAQTVVNDTLKSFLNDISEEQLAGIKSNLVGGFPLRFDSNGKKLGYLSMIGFYNLPLDYLEWFPKEVDKVTKSDVLKAWNNLVKPEKMVTIMVGKPE